MKKEGNWLIYYTLNENTNFKYKVKLNTKNKVTKTAFYYEPLREKLPKLKEADDPISLRH